MKIEAVIVCVDYADFLAETLPHNLPHFDRTLVITSPRDVETQELCRRLSVPYYATNLFHKDGDTFNKARGIDFGLGYLRYNDWVVHLDADTYLPPMTRKWLEWRPLDRESIYGIDRVNCVGYEPWKAFLAEHHTGHDYMCRTKVPPFPLLDRIAIRDYGGYCRSVSSRCGTARSAAATRSPRATPSTPTSCTRSSGTRPAGT